MIVLGIMMLSSISFGATYTSSSLSNLPKKVKSIPTNYPGSTGSCNFLSSFDVKHYTGPFPNKAPWQDGHCHVKLYNSPNYRDAQYSPREKRLEPLLGSSFDIPSKTMSIGTRNCRSPLWLMACGGGKCSFSEHNGHIANLGSHGLAGRVKEVYVCQSKNECAQKVGIESIQNPETGGRVILPCHSELVEFDEKQLQKAVVDIINYVASDGILYYQKQKRIADQLVDYWAAIQNRRELDKILSKIPTRDQVIGAAQERKKHAQELKDFLEKFVRSLSSFVEDAKAIRSSALDERKEYFSYVDKIHIDIQQSSLPILEKFKYIYALKSDLARRSQKNRLVIKSAIANLENLLSGYHALGRQLDSMENGFPDSSRFSNKLQTIKQKAAVVKASLETIKNRLVQIHESHDKETDDQQKKVDLALQKAKEDGIRAGLEKQLKEAKKYKASSDFLNQVNTWFVDLRKSFPISSYEDLPYLAEKYEHYTSLLKYEDICEGKIEVWMESGCKTMTNHFLPAVRTEIEAIKSSLDFSLMWMQVFGPESEEASSLYSLIEGGRIREVLARYDGILRRNEEAAQ